MNAYIRWWILHKSLSQMYCEYSGEIKQGVRDKDSRSMPRDSSRGVGFLLEDVVFRLNSGPAASNAGRKSELSEYPDHPRIQRSTARVLPSTPLKIKRLL